MTCPECQYESGHALTCSKYVEEKWPKEEGWRETLDDYCDHTNCTEKCDLIILVESLLQKEREQAKVEGMVEEAIKCHDHTETARRAEGERILREATSLCQEQEDKEMRHPKFIFINDLKQIIGIN